MVFSGESSMALALWLRKLPTRIWSKNYSHSLILDEKTFRYELARERMRVDRNGSPLAILIIELPANRATRRDVGFLGRVLLRRLRITDTIGFLSERRLGVLLPDTSKSGAWKVASDICSVYPVGHDRPSCDVLVYPDESSWHRDSSVDPKQEPARNETVLGVEALLTQPMPIWKRAIDVVGAVAGLCVAAPLLLALGCAVKLSSRGPIFFSQEREGLGGRRFQIYKLRTMRMDAEQYQSALRGYSVQDGPAFKMYDDPRTTWIGRWLRRTSLDELPQLWNVLRGEMSLVGPRPLPTDESLQCEPWQRQRLSVLPGMTCSWQCWGRNTVSFDHWMRMDLQYVRQRSLAYDLQLLVSTGPSLVLGRGPR
jgi:lipopolysaccharide/colanic/teichoic acid biosynthesis glycosyltransferase